MRFVDTLKKMLVLMVAATAITVVYLPNSAAATLVEILLQQISNNTYSTMQTADKIYQLMVQDGSNEADDGKNGPSFIANNIEKFRVLGEYFARSQELQDDNQTQVFADMLGVSPSTFTFNDEGTNPALRKLKNPNEIAYATMLGAKPVNGGSSDPYNYLKYVGLFYIPRPMPDPAWQGKEDDKKRYFEYYKSLTAIQSFNNYLLTRMKTDLEVEGNPRTNPLRNELIRVASARNFQEQVASKSSGKIMRWLLLFTAQNYVLNTQIQQSLRQMVQAQAMSNSLMILFNTPNENQLIRNAKGLPLGQ
jgi:hypothetical protein